MNKDQSPDIQNLQIHGEVRRKDREKGNQEKYRFVRLNEPAPKGAAIRQL